MLNILSTTTFSGQIDFLEDASAWLKELGYSLSSSSANRASGIFAHNYDEHAPSITCTIVDGTPCCFLEGSFLKLFLSLKLQYRHPDIKKYIDTMSHLCKENPPL